MGGLRASCRRLAAACATSTRQAGLEESLSRLRDVSLPKAVSELSMAQERAAVETSKDLTRMRHEVSHGDDRAAASTGDWAGDNGGTPGCCRSLVRWAWRRIACWQLWPSRRPSRRSRSRRYRQAARGACLPVHHGGLILLLPAALPCTSRTWSRRLWRPPTRPLPFCPTRHRPQLRRPLRLLSPTLP